MQIPEIPTLPADIMETLEPVVQNHIRAQAGIIALLQEIVQQHTQLQTQYGQLQTEHSQVQQRLTDLEQRLAQNSENSSKPPSSNPLWTRPPKTPKSSSGKKRGGQAGHTRHSRQLLPTSEVDLVREWWPALCQECKAPLRASDQIGTPKRHQVYEIERVHAKVTEHQFFACECRFCSTLTKASHPTEVPTGNFGSELVATLADLHGRYRLSMRETAALARDLWQLELSVGAVADACQKASLALASSYTEAHTHLKAHSSEVNVDETGWRDSGKRGWLWVAVSKVATVFKLGSKRNRASFQELIPKDYLGVVGSDRYSAYYALDPARHQLCLAHILRNLKGLEVRAEPTAKWATTTRELVTSLFHSWHTFKINPTPDAAQKRATLLAEVEPIRIAITEQLELGLTLQPEDKKLTRFCRQLKKHEARLWVFVNVQGIEPTNNAAERALRPAVIWRKTSFGTQGENGQRFVERMLTIRATCRLSGHNFLEFLSASLKAHWSSQPMPSLFATP